MARHLTGCGMDVALCARTEAELRDTAAAIGAATGRTVPYAACDIADFNAVEVMVANLSRALGGLDAVINNAAIPGPVAPLEETPQEAWNAAISVNLLGSVNVCRAVLPILKAQGRGKIVNVIGAGVGWRNFHPGKTAYITSKFALAGFSEALARELSGDGIQVNSLSPGSVDSRLRDALADDALKQAAHDAGEPLTPDTACQMAAFLVSDASGPLTGKMISARWDDPAWLAENTEAYNRSCLGTLRKIDGRNYAPLPLLPLR